MEWKNPIKEHHTSSANFSRVIWLCQEETIDDFGPNWSKNYEIDISKYSTLLSGNSQCAYQKKFDLNISSLSDVSVAVMLTITWCCHQSRHPLTSDNIKKKKNYNHIFIFQFPFFLLTIFFLFYTFLSFYSFHKHYLFYFTNRSANMKVLFFFS